jgi:ribosomal protein S18 acetylase RimI-like enzyme
MSIRQAVTGDREGLHGLNRDFFDGSPNPEWYGVSVEQELSEVDEIVDAGLAFVAEEDGRLVGFALGRRKAGTHGVLTDLYVRPEDRLKGIARGLTHAVADALRKAGATHVTLSVGVDNSAARNAYASWGFRERVLILGVDVDELIRRIADAEDTGPSYGSAHVQTDDVAAVTRAVSQFIPRLAAHSQGTIVSPPRNGWIAVYDEAADREPELLRRIARELSDRMGAVTLSIGVEGGHVVRYLLYERGRMVDEYLSVPEHYGPLPPGDAVALGANPTVVARLTGADPREIRAIARVAASPADLPPAAELLSQLATAMKLEGADHGYADAGDIEGATRI